MHEAPTNAGFGEGSMYAALPLHAERLFPRFEPVTSRSQWCNLTVTMSLICMDIKYFIFTLWQLYVLFLFSTRFTSSKRFIYNVYTSNTRGNIMLRMLCVDENAEICM